MMKICTTSVDLQKEIALSGGKPGFVPTMGALHEGHLTLVRKSASENDITVVSIFINPTQFNNPDDFEKYPRTTESDRKLLAGIGADILFEPSVAEMYPQGNAEADKQQFQFGDLEKVMEGKFRPGHFKGVAQVVKKLLEMVAPRRAYFGEKDFQQLAVIRRLVADYNIPVEIIGCPTVREASGLAMSSRNLRLTAAQRTEAANISRALFWLHDMGRNFELPEALNRARAIIESDGTLKTEYLEIADEDTLQPVASWNDSEKLRAFAAVLAGEVRLIDNVSLIRTDT